MTSVQNHVTSYDTGQKLFIHDNKRGKWSSPEHFFYACIGNIFGCSHFTIISLMVYWSSGAFAIIPLFFAMVIYSLPMFVMHSFLGQFSSTGYISVFRIAPLMKGIGYAILFVNMISLTYGSVLAAVPLLFVFSSMAFTLPWMNCNNRYNTEHCFKYQDVQAIRDIVNNTERGSEIIYNISSAEFYRNFIHVIGSESPFEFSWPVFLCLIVVWALAAFTVLQNIEWLGKLFRNACLVMAVLLSAIFLRSIFLISNLEWKPEYSFGSSSLMDIELWVTAPLLLVYCMGSGWGNVLSLASYNKFNSNINKWSWMVCTSMIIINLLSGLIISFLDMYAEDTLTLSAMWSSQHPMNHLFDNVPLVLGTLELPNMWSLFFFAMIFIGEMCTIIVKLHSVITALCDEFENLRDIRMELTAALIGIQMIFSIYFCFSHGYGLFGFLLEQEVVPQQIIGVLIIIVVFWIYGRIRFQRDIKIMNNIKYSNGKIFIIRFVTPLICLITMLIGIAEAILFTQGRYGYTYVEKNLIIMISFIILLSFFAFIPTYIFYKIMQLTGTIGERFRKMVRPTDWYPAESDDRQRYEENLGTSDISHQLVVTTIDVDSS